MAAALWTSVFPGCLPKTNGGKGLHDLFLFSCLLQHHTSVGVQFRFVPRLLCGQDGSNLLGSANKALCSTSLVPVFKALPFLWVNLLVADPFPMFLCHLKCRMWGTCEGLCWIHCPEEEVLTPGAVNQQKENGHHLIPQIPGELANGQMKEETREALVLRCIESFCVQVLSTEHWPHQCSQTDCGRAGCRLVLQL